jgi:Leucine-rich repeat (LRR) protein
MGQERALTAARFPIGNYEFCDPDYRQILLWAKALELEPADIVRRLEGSFRACADRSRLTFSVENGSIVTLAWDFSLLPLSVIEWVDGLVIREVGFKGLPTAPLRLSLRLPLLVRLTCPAINLAEIDLSNVAALKELDCGLNQLTKLDLSNVAGLTDLDCGCNQLAELDLSNVPELVDLVCDDNQLTKLDLSNVPRLTHFRCSDNQLSELDLSNVAGLTELSCPSNQLTELDLSNVPRLAELLCGSNHLTELDLSNVPGLRELACSDNQLTELDLSNVQELAYLNCENNQLTSLDLSKVPGLSKLRCDKNQVAELDIRSLRKLTDFVCDRVVTLKKPFTPGERQLSQQDILLQESTVYAFHVPSLNAIKVGFGADGRSRMTNYSRQYKLSASATTLREWKLPSPTIASSIEGACHKALRESDFMRIRHVVDEREAQELFDLGPHTYEQAVIIVAEAIEQTVNSLYEALGSLQPLSNEQARQQKENAQRRRIATRAGRKRLEQEQEGRFISAAIPDIQSSWASEIQPFVVQCELAKQIWKQFDYHQGIFSTLWAGKRSAATRLMVSNLYPQIKALIPQIFLAARRAKSFYCEMLKKHAEYSEMAAKQLGYSFRQPGGHDLPLVDYDDPREGPFLEVRLVVQLAAGIGGNDAIELMALDAELMALVRTATANPAPELKTNNSR